MAEEWGFLLLPFWRAGGWEDVTYRTQIYLTPLSQRPVRLGVYLFENGGRPWANKTFKVELDQQVSEAITDANGMIELRVGPGQTIRIEINALEHEYGTGEVHLLDGNEPVPILARGDLEVFAAEASGFEMSMSAIEITGARPITLIPGR